VTLERVITEVDGLKIVVGNDVNKEVYDIVIPMTPNYENEKRLQD
jgi:hypothetical protein